MSTTATTTVLTSLPPIKPVSITMTTVQPFISPRQDTARKLVAAFNAMDIPAIISFRAPNCMRHLIPDSMGNKPQNNEQYAQTLQKLIVVFQNFSLTVTDTLEDSTSGRLCMWLHARADTCAGEYINDYVWLLDFDESGRRITCSKEYSDTVMFKEFFPKLQAAMKAKQAESDESMPTPLQGQSNQQSEVSEQESTASAISSVDISPPARPSSEG